MKFLLIITVLMPLLALIMFLLAVIFNHVSYEKAAKVCFYIAIGALILTAILIAVITIIAIMSVF